MREQPDKLDDAPNHHIHVTLRCTNTGLPLGTILAFHIDREYRSTCLVGFVVFEREGIHFEDFRRPVSARANTELNRGKILLLQCFENALFLLK